MSYANNGRTSAVAKNNVDIFVILVYTKNMKTGSIYIIKNTINDKVYVGQTTMSVYERFSAHKKPSTQKQHGSYKIYNAMSKYGVENFYVEILETDIPISMLDEKEIGYIAFFDSYNNGYNSTKGGDGRMITKIDNEETLLELYKRGLKAKEIADELGCCKATVFRTLRKLGFQFHDVVDKSKLIELYNQGLSYGEIANKMNIPEWTIERWCVKLGLRRRKEYMPHRDYFNYDGLIEDYYSNLPIETLCEKYDISKTTFYRIKKDKNLSTRPQVYKYKTVYKK